ncbi:hypothetical protein VNI00_009316 [Paramarasmius palmivorus]|uniref:tRNA (cytosine(38)-C(5))-methyltransferase n=1 Tax=Paramarasmius palmivorus TaxID=297713 RepID=A0AAW0CSJ0_9AGAR
MCLEALPAIPTQNIAQNPSFEGDASARCDEGLSKDERQVDLLVRLRIIEQLQQISNHPRFRNAGHPEDLITDILNWISLCFCPNFSSDDVAVAFATFNGRITLYVSSTEHCPSSRSLELSKDSLLGAFKRIFERTEIIPNISARLLLRMIVDNCYLRIQRKISLLGNSDSNPETTAHRFMSLVNSWMFYRPEGETSKGFTNMALTHTGDVSETTEYMIQSFYTIANQADVRTDGMSADERFNYLTSIISACDLFVKSSFFADLVNHHTFRLTLKPQDRIFLHTLLRRLTQIAAYKTGAAKFAFIGIPYMLDVLGPSGKEEFLGTSGDGHGITIELLSHVPKSKTFTWPEPPIDRLSALLGLNDTGSSIPNHSRETSAASNSTCDSSSSSCSLGCHFNVHAYQELSRLDNQLRLDLLDSGLLSEAWIEGKQVESRSHSVIQLVHYLEDMNIEISCWTIGTSKPICWVCDRYLRSLEYCLEVECRASEVEEETELERMTPRKWYTSKGSGKVKHDWLIPPNAKRDVVLALIEEAQKEMERVVEEFNYLLAYRGLSGIGGLHLALETSKVEATVCRAFDWDQNACKVYEANYGSGLAQRVDISTLTAEILGSYGAELWLLSPSCQPYTVLNPSAKGELDPRAQSFLHLIQNVLPEMVLSNTQPTHLLVENVAGFEFSSTRTFLLEQLKHLGYFTAEFLLTPLQFGIPNSRLRYYLLARCTPFNFDSDTVHRSIPGAENIQPSDYFEAKRDGSATIPEIRTYLDASTDSNVGSTWHPHAIPDRVLIKWGRLFDIVLPSSRRTCCFTRGYTQLVERAGSVLQMNEELNTTATFDTFLANERPEEAVRILHPLKLRYFTPSELLRLFAFEERSSSFRLSWPPDVSTKSKYRLIGNSVNVRVVRELVELLCDKWS